MKYRLAEGNGECFYFIGESPSMACILPLLAATPPPLPPLTNHRHGAEQSGSCFFRHHLHIFLLQAFIILQDVTRALPSAALEQVQPLSPDIAWADQSMLTTHRG